MTVLDHRRLVFDDRGIRACIECGGKVAEHLALPPPTPYAVHLRPAEGCIDVVHAAEGEAGPHTLIQRFNRQQVAALLLDYCIRTGIPVPRNCTRNIAVQDEAVTLTFAKRITGGARATSG